MINLRWRLVKWWYKLRYGVSIGDLGGGDGSPNRSIGSMLPVFGDGQFVSVLQNGPYLEITSHHENKHQRGMIRLIPYQPNHGVMVEFVAPDGCVMCRGHMDYNAFMKVLYGQRESAG